MRAVARLLRRHLAGAFSSCINLTCRIDCNFFTLTAYLLLFSMNQCAKPANDKINESFESMPEATAAEKRLKNKATENTKAQTISQSLANDDQRQVSSSFYTSPRQKSFPIDISGQQMSYDQSDEQMTRTSEYQRFLQELKSHPGLLNESILARKWLDYRIERGECIVGSPQNGYQTLLLPGVIPIFTRAQSSKCFSVSKSCFPSTASHSFEVGVVFDMDLN